MLSLERWSETIENLESTGRNDDSWGSFWFFSAPRVSEMNKILCVEDKIETNTVHYALYDNVTR